MSFTGKILVVDDEPDIREVIRLLLISEGYTVSEAADGLMAIELADNDFDLIILDVMMPKLNGFLTCEKIRKKTNAPVLFLTAKSQDSDKTLGFSVGGDDYLVKPFSYNELISRVKAMIRRYREYSGVSAAHLNSNIIEINNLCINRETGGVLLGDTPVVLTDIEFRILLLLAESPKKIFSAQNIFESVWEEPYYYSSNNTVMVHIRNLRKKLGQGNSECVIKTVWGKGYKML